MRQKMVEEQGNDKEQHPEENYTGVEVDTEEDDEYITDHLCIHRQKRFLNQLAHELFNYTRLKSPRRMITGRIKTLSCSWETKQTHRVCLTHGSRENGQI